MPVPDRDWQLGDYLDYWLEQVVRPNRRPKTYELYEVRIRLNLKPALGRYSLRRLSVPMVQTFLNQQLADAHSVRKVQIMRTVLSAALTRALREELVSRNVARLVELPTWQRAEIRPWTIDEARRFLRAARAHPLYPAFVLLLLYGLRRGEVLGLRWCDVDTAKAEIRIRQQLVRVGRVLDRGPVKTKAGRRDLPLLGFAHDVLTERRRHQYAAQAMAGQAWTSGDDAGDELVFTTRYGTPIEPRNFVRSFWRICGSQGLRVIKVHHLRHTAATLLKELGVPARDAQLILGHASIITTQELYQHGDMESRRRALSRMESVLKNSVVGGYCRQKQPSRRWIVEIMTAFLSGGPTGTRTQDTLLKSLTSSTFDVRVKEVQLVMQRRTRAWLLGMAAVNFSRQPSRPVTLPATHISSNPHPNINPLQDMSMMGPSA